jgi:DNA-binding LytR/AlgR family response regulator
MIGENTSADGGRLLVRSSRSVRLVAVGDIRWAESAGHYLRLHLADASLLYRCSMESFSVRMSSEFIRIHRSYIVRTADIVEFARRGSGGAMIRLRDGPSLPVGRAFLSGLKEGLGLS